MKGINQSIVLRRRTTACGGEIHEYKNFPLCEEETEEDCIRKSNREEGGGGVSSNKIAARTCRVG